MEKELTVKIIQLNKRFIFDGETFENKKGDRLVVAMGEEGLLINVQDEKVGTYEVDLSQILKLATDLSREEK